MSTLLRIPASAARKPSPDRVELILSQLDKLPTPSPVASKLLAVSASDDASLAGIVEILRADAALSAGVIRLTHRADLGARAAKMDIHKAVTLLGLRRVRNAVIAQQFFRILEAEPGSPQAQLCKQLWKHNLAVGCACEAIVEVSRGSRWAIGLSSGEAFVCGLLHDVGKLALAESLPKSYARVVELCKREKFSTCDAEQDILGVDHTVAGKRIASRWGLPTAVVECIWFHHQGLGMLPASAKFADAIRVVQLADAVMNRAGFTISQAEVSVDLDATCRALDVDPGKIESIVEKAIQRLRPLCELVEIDLELDPAAQITRLTEANRELGELTSVLILSERIQSRRARCMDSIAAFIDTQSDGFTAGDVCMSAARAFGAMGAIAPVALIRRIDAENHFIGDTNHYDVQKSTHVFEFMSNRRDESDSFGPRNSSSRPHAIIPAPTWAKEMRHTIVESDLTNPLWLIACSSAGIECGVIFEMPESMINELSADNADLRVVTTMFVRSALAAFEHSDTQRLAEDALDMNRRLHDAQKDLLRIRSLDMVAQMAAGAAHEMNNPLSVISGRAQMMRAKTGEEDMQRGLDIIIEQSKRASGIVTELMRFSKPEPPAPLALPLKDTLESICQRWCASISQPPSVISVATSDPTVAVFADSTHLREIMEAILTNALEASAGKPDIQVNSDSRQTDDIVRITVTDRGRGMTLETVEHALDPFYSNRPAGRGRGLGLSRAYRLVESNGGRLWIESKVNVGTTVSFELPARAPTASRD